MSNTYAESGRFPYITTSVFIRTKKMDCRVDCVTHELTLQDVENDPTWITKSTCIVSSNVDRAIINAEAAKAFGKRNNVPIL